VENLPNNVQPEEEADSIDTEDKEFYVHRLEDFEPVVNQTVGAGEKKEGMGA